MSSEAGPVGGAPRPAVFVPRPDPRVRALSDAAQQADPAVEQQRAERVARARALLEGGLLDQIEVYRDTARRMLARGFKP
ncbi:MAG: hypothetical protein IPM29_28000 [Planctomycetes bacterium]|nr:hypothetical protein [Planctomycetota bacterium]